jgi:hypothetical protein
VSCTDSRGVIYEGIGEITTEDVSLDDIPETKTNVMLNVADPSDRPPAGGACPPTVSAWRGWSSWCRTSSGRIRWRS